MTNINIYDKQTHINMYFFINLMSDKKIYNSNGFGKLDFHKLFCRWKQKDNVPLC